MNRHRIGGTNFARHISYNRKLVMIGSLSTVSDSYLFNPDPGYLLNLNPDLDPEWVFDDKN